MEAAGRAAIAADTSRDQDGESGEVITRPVRPEVLHFERVVSTRDGMLFALDVMEEIPGFLPSPFVLDDDAASGQAAGALLTALFSRVREFPGAPVLILGVSAKAFGEDSGTLTMIDLAAGNAGLDSGRIVLEVAPAPGALHPALDTLDEVRALGFRVSLSDSGLSEEGLRMLLDLRPDYIRLGADFVRGSSIDYYRRAILDSFSELAWRFGALLIAGGADEPGDRATLLEAGVVLMKGRLSGAALKWEDLANPAGFISRPQARTHTSSEPSFEDRSGRKHG